MIRTTVLLLAFVATSVFAGEKSASSCLPSAEPKNCLADFAVAALANENDVGSKLEGLSVILTALSKANVRRDDIFALATDNETAPIFSRWTLAVSRNTYAFHFGLPVLDGDEPSRLDAMASAIRSKRDGMVRLSIIVATCEARGNEKMEVLAKWNGMLDRHCRMDDSDADALEKEIHGLSAMSAPIVDAYNDNEQALRSSLSVSLDVLDRYEKALSQRMTTQDRESIRGILFFGHMFNAMALATAGHFKAASEAGKIALDNLRKAPSIVRNPEFQIVRTIASWVFAKAGLRDVAMKEVRYSLAKIDSGKKISGGDKAIAIAMAIDTLHVLEISR